MCQLGWATEIQFWGEPQHPWRALLITLLWAQNLQWKLLSLIRQIKMQCGSWGDRVQGMTSVTKVMVVTVVMTDSRVKATIRLLWLVETDLWHSLVDHGVPRNGIDGMPTEFLLDLCKQKSSTSTEQKSNLNHKTGSWSLNQFPDFNQFIGLLSQYFLNEGEARSSWKRTPVHC